MPSMVTQKEDYYVSQDELWEWDDGSDSTSADHTDFTFCLDSTDEDGMKRSPYSFNSKKKKRKAKTIFSLELGQYETINAKEILSESSRSPSSFGGFGDFKVKGKKDSLKKSRKFKSDVLQCKVHLPYKSPSKLILLQKQQHDTLFTSPACGGTPEGPYFNTFLLDNPTSSSVAFKIYCNSTAWTHFTVKPALGVISPNSRFSVGIKTKMSRRKNGGGGGTQIDSLDVQWDQFTVKFFPAYFTGKEETSQYLKLLKKQCPHLIHAIRLPRVVLWDARDLHSMLDSLATCETTKEALKKQLYHRYVTHSIPVARRNARLNEKYFQILAANQRMRRTLSLVYFAIKAEELVLFVVFCVLTFIFVLPHF